MALARLGKGSGQRDYIHNLDFPNNVKPALARATVSSLITATL